MIIKGKSRDNPRQLSRYLLRKASNERVELIEVRDPSNDIHEALYEWQMLTGITRGEKGLYHAEINPDSKYEMTREQWFRAADVLEQELGLAGQPRVMVMHRKNGRDHMHVVWQRTDVEKGILIPDSHNYRAHERASRILEKEFGHEKVPDKRAKLQKGDLSKTFNYAEWQQAQRRGEDPRDRKTLITELYRAAETAEAFRAALDTHGYILARGERRAYLIVDTYGGHSSLSRNLNGVNTKQIKEKLDSIPLDSLPSLEEAKAVQMERAAEREKKATEPPQPEPPSKEPPESETAPEADRSPDETLHTDTELDESLNGTTDETRPPLEQAFADVTNRTLTATQQATLKLAVDRLAAIRAEMEQRHAAERQIIKDRHIDARRIAMGLPENTPPEEIWQRYLANEGSRFVPEIMRQEAARLPQAERELRRNTFSAIHDTESKEFVELEARQRPERDARQQQEITEAKRLGERFDLEKKRAIKPPGTELDEPTEGARERELDRDDDFTR